MGYAPPNFNKKEKAYKSLPSLSDRWKEAMRNSLWLLLAAALLLWLLAAQLDSAWPQTVQELKLMTLKELQWEAVQQCVGAVVANKNIYGSTTQRIVASDMLIARLKQLDRVYLVARQKNGGEFPSWVSDIKRASTGVDYNLCRGRR